MSAPWAVLETKLCIFISTLMCKYAQIRDADLLQSEQDLLEVKCPGRPWARVCFLLPVVVVQNCWLGSFHAELRVPSLSAWRPPALHGRLLGTRLVHPAQLKKKKRIMWKNPGWRKSTRLCSLIWTLCGSNRSPGEQMWFSEQVWLLDFINFHFPMCFYFINTQILVKL